MSKWQVSRRTVVLALAGFVVLAGVSGCSRQLTVPGAAKSVDSGQLPFDRVSDGSGISPTAAFAPETVPVGTEITIQLRSALSSADARKGDTFEAVLDDPVVVIGKTVVPQGTPVTGSVLAAKGAGGLHNPGYLRLTLASIVLSGKSVPLQSSSLFAKGGAHQKRSQLATAHVSEADNAAAGTAVESPTTNRASPELNRGDVRFSTGHRFTFRLVQPLHLPN